MADKALPKGWLLRWVLQMCPLLLTAARNHGHIGKQWCCEARTIVVIVLLQLLLEVQLRSLVDEGWEGCYLFSFAAQAALPFFPLRSHAFDVDQLRNLCFEVSIKLDFDPGVGLLEVFQFAELSECEDVLKHPLCPAQEQIKCLWISELVLDVMFVLGPLLSSLLKHLVCVVDQGCHAHQQALVLLPRLRELLLKLCEVNRVELVQNLHL